MTVSLDDKTLIDREVFARARAELGAGFVRILGYFREDGVKSVGAIEAAMRAQNAAAMVIPAHTLKGEALQFGAEPLGVLAERIEMIARDCLENHDTPDQALSDVVALRPLFEATLAKLDRESNPLVERRPQFGRRVG
ncbi:Hpt domain-containing protein [Sphingomonas sp. RB3P16]|uniref:Hpt domain-containing protein n=1 Tax=Parasphingomonas frigoris TaxID=3096163 RepID=UPI002FC87D4C